MPWHREAAGGIWRRCASLQCTRCDGWAALPPRRPGWHDAPKSGRPPGAWPRQPPVLHPAVENAPRRSASGSAGTADAVHLQNDGGRRIDHFDRCDRETVLPLIGRFDHGRRSGSDPRSALWGDPQSALRIDLMGDLRTGYWAWADRYRSAPSKSDQPMDDHWVACPLAVVHFRSPHLAPNVHRGMGRWSGVQSEGSWCARQRYRLDPACSR